MNQNLEQQPLISIVIPSYNQGEFIEDTILSVLRQNYHNYEIILVDGGSDDNTSAVINKYKNSFTFWCSEPDEGQAAAINKGFLHAKGDIYCWLNSDDLLEPGALEFVARNLRVGENDWIAGASKSLRGKGLDIHLRKPGNISFETFLQYRNCWFPQPSVFWTREIWFEVGGVNSIYQYNMDLDFFFRMYCIEKPVVTDEILSSHRVHENAKTIKDGPEVDREYAQWLEGLMSDDQANLDHNVTKEILARYIHLQRCYRVMSEHIVLSRVITFWKRFINSNLYI